jgi:mRNA interferase MazF
VTPNPTRGEVYWIKLGDHADDQEEGTEGSEQSGKRPGIVLQNDSENHYGYNTTVVVPTTTGSADEAEHLTTIFIGARETCFEEDSIALCKQIRVVDIDERFDGKLGTLSPKKMREVSRGVEVALDLL